MSDNLVADARREIQRSGAALRDLQDIALRIRCPLPQTMSVCGAAARLREHVDVLLAFHHCQSLMLQSLRGHIAGYCSTDEEE